MLKSLGRIDICVLEHLKLEWILICLSQTTLNALLTISNPAHCSSNWIILTWKVESRTNSAGNSIHWNTWNILVDIEALEMQCTKKSSTKWNYSVKYLIDHLEETWANS